MYIRVPKQAPPEPTPPTKPTKAEKIAMKKSRMDEEKDKAGIVIPFCLFVFSFSHFLASPFFLFFLFLIIFLLFLLPFPHISSSFLIICIGTFFLFAKIFYLQNKGAIYCGQLTRRRFYHYWKWFFQCKKSLLRKPLLCENNSEKRKKITLWTLSCYY